MVADDIRETIKKLGNLIASEKDKEKLEVLNHAKVYLLQYLDRINQDSSNSQKRSSES